MIVLTVIPIVIAGLAAAIITSFKDQAGIYNRLSDSHDAQITSSYFVPDVESASFVNTNVAGVPCESIVAQVLLELTETAPGGQTEQIYYVDNTINYHPDSQQNAMLRIACNGTVPLGNNTIVAHSVTSATATVSCVTPAPVAPAPQAPWSPTWTPCTAAGGSAPGVSSVALTVSEVPTTSGNVPLDSFTYSLTATPRAWVPETALATGGAPVPGLLLLGPNMRNGADLISFTGPATGQKLTTTASTPSGDIDVDSNSAGSVSMTGNDAISAAGNFNIYHCAASAGTACTNGAVSSTGTNNTVAPGPVSLATAVQDPLSNLPTPVVPSLSSAPPCTGQVGSTISISNQTITCQPGLYSSGLDITGTHDVITFVGGAGAEYQFGTPGCTGAHCALTGLIVTGANDTLNFQSATYVFEGAIADVNGCSSSGLAVANKGGISLSGGGDILQDNGAGVFLDIVGGPADFGCGVTTDNTVDLSPMTTGLYQGILLFDDRTPTDPQIVVLDGVTTTGIIYAPDSYVDVWGNAMNTTGSIVAQTLDLTGNLTIQ